MKSIQIADRHIGPNGPVLVIAEIGVNHDGLLSRAIELVHAARDAGADAVKLQLFDAQRLMNGEARFASYQAGRVATPSPGEMLRQYQLHPLELVAVVEEIGSCGMIPLATPFSAADVETIESLGLSGVKIASPDLVNRPLLVRAAQLGLPMLISVGAATMDEAGQCAAWMREFNSPFCFLHCVSSYPTPNDQAHLRWITELAEQFSVPVGYSDHTTNLLAGAMAVACGATVIEKHLTYDCAAAGPDHAASADPRAFAAYVQRIREAEQLCGRRGKRVLPIERDVRTVSRQSLVLVRDVGSGEAIAENDLIFQRPGTGIPAAALGRLVGKRVSRALRAGTLLQWDMLADVA